MVERGHAVGVANNGDRTLVLWTEVTGDGGPQRDAWRLYDASWKPVATGSLGSATETRPAARAFPVADGFVVVRSGSRWTIDAAGEVRRSAESSVDEAVLDPSGRRWAIAGRAAVSRGSATMKVPVPARASLVSLAVDRDRAVGLVTRYDKNVSRVVALVSRPRTGPVDRPWTTLRTNIAFPHDATLSIGLMPDGRFVIEGIGTPSYVVGAGGTATRIKLPASVDDSSVFAAGSKLYAAAGTKLWASPDLGGKWALLNH